MSMGELRAICERTERMYAEKGLLGEPSFKVSIYRACKGKRVRVAPGPRGGVHLHGEVIRAGTGKHDPATAVVKCRDVRRFLAQFQSSG